ncbi:HDOD domain-containing protein [Noviherbaspirillum sp. Root189]|uniref:HDOD domain-containing protein n=1 Tax=Noviherbaspirillum sp. Root189 TaxID=1736487 RepID=UPI00070CBE7A|nr:HDOD domain-containing protein [Noviherbaspirillum sp. Root189]KRB79536.1 histidine kinase [Noviherbaspirillum sp. Root189]
MNAIALTDVVKQVRDLPSLPLIVMELIESFEQKDISISVLADKVSHDQALAAKTLRLANSSFYGLQSKVKTIQQAITVLGFDSVRALITAAAVIDNFGAKEGTSFNFKGFWRQAIGTALCAKSLARMSNLNQDYAFISGLLHDIGKLVLVTRFPQQYEQARLHRIANDCYMLDAERAVLAVDHTAVGRALAEHWKFPPLIQRAIANHHAPLAQDLGDIPSVVHVANAVVHALDLGEQEDDLVPHIAENAWNSLNIERTALQRVFRETESEFEEVCQILAA